MVGGVWAAGMSIKEQVMDEYIDPMFTRLTDRYFPTEARPSLPGRCDVCRSWPAQPVCQPCTARFAPQTPRCQHCAIALPLDMSVGLRTSPGVCLDCIAERPPLDRTFAAVAYAYPWSGLVGRYKFGDQPAWAPIFAALLLKAHGARESMLALDARDWVVPMPLSIQRLETRGFNQAWQLATALARLSGTAAHTDARLLLRLKDTRPQSQLKRVDRLTNVKGAFAVDPLRNSNVSGRRVVLVDDVMTSGASLFTAAAALKQAGATHVMAMVFARTD
jgi:ComF family protein